MTITKSSGAKLPVSDCSPIKKGKYFLSFFKIHFVFSIFHECYTFCRECDAFIAREILVSLESHY